MEQKRHYEQALHSGLTRFHAIHFSRCTASSYVYFCPTSKCTRWARPCAMLPSNVSGSWLFFWIPHNQGSKDLADASFAAEPICSMSFCFIEIFVWTSQKDSTVRIHLVMIACVLTGHTDTLCLCPQMCHDILPAKANCDWPYLFQAATSQSRTHICGRTSTSTHIMGWVGSKG